MMDPTLEEKRSLHEKRDRLEQALADEILNKKSSHREALESEHRQKYLLDDYKSCSERLLHLYEQPTSINYSDIFKNFYRDLREICSAKDETIIEIADCSAPDPHIEFTDEENFGKYLDMIKCHEEYLQVIKKEETKPNYLEFLEKFDKFEIDPALKTTTAYKRYLDTLVDYFRNFSKRAKPLFDYRDMEKTIEEKFVQEWKSHSTENGAMVDLDSYKSCHELIGLGLDCLKKELQARGLKCGGTLEERANRLWSVKGRSEDQIDDSLRAGCKIGKKKSTIDPYQVALVEAKVETYAEYYNDHRLATIENVQRKQARTADERNDSEEEISDIDDADQDDGEVVYNPKNLPLGWDGKPIPYWLYKLHGLNLTFTCEICGNATYKGPKTFQRHFAEWRHAHGMRCLDIPNTAHFANITKIQDAITLWEKLKTEKQKDKFQPSNEEEYEDSQGNVVNKKTYEDLKRQGLL